MKHAVPPLGKAPSRVAALDVLRGIAVLSVLVSHAKLENTSLPWACAQSLNAAARFFSGVDLFFVLSGFLVSGLLLREHQRYGSIHARRFLIRRGLKIYPSFYAFLLTSIAVSWVFQIWPHPTPTNIASEALFVQNYGTPLWSHTWSLAVEEHFYLCLVALLVGLLKIRRGNGVELIPVIVVCVAVTCLSVRCITAWIIPEFSFHRHLAPSHLRFDSLAFGMLLSYWHHRQPQAVSVLIEGRRFRLAFIGFLLLAWCALVPRHTLIGHTIIQTAQYVGHGLLLLLAIADHRVQWIHGTTMGRILQMIGKYSYSVYLWHMGVLVWSRTLISDLMGHVDSYSDLAVLTYAALVIPVGIATAHLVEIPVLAIRDQFFPSRSDDLRSLATAGQNP